MVGTGVVDKSIGASTFGGNRTNLLSEDSQGTLSGFTNTGIGAGLLVIGEESVVAESGNFSHLADGVRGGNEVFDDLAVAGDITNGSKGSALNIKLNQVVAKLVEVNNLVDAHLIGSKSTSLVGADDAAAAQGFDRRQATDDSVLGGHLSGSESETGGDNNSKTFGNSGNTKRNGDLEVVDGALGPATMAGVVEVGDVDQPNGNADDSDNLGEAVTKVVQLLLQGSGLGDLGGNALVNVTNGGVRSSQHDNSLGASSDDGCAGEKHVNLILQDSLLVANNSGGILADAFTLSGKDGLVDVEAVALDGNNSAIGRNAVTNGHRDNITGN